MNTKIKKMRVLRATDDELAAIYEALCGYEHDLRRSIYIKYGDDEIVRTLRDVRSALKKVKKAF